ncbi:MAG: PilW family protein [Burkholderiales bacterium]|nr:PilW family protein [Burkholderiales bacterium]
MCTRPCSPAPRRRERGFTLVELMVGVVIALLTVLVIMQTLSVSEGVRRSVNSGSDAQVNGALALQTLQQALLTAGYGFASSPQLLGCPVSARFGGSPVAAGAASPRFPTSLVPVVIDGSDPSRNAIRTIASAKTGFAIPSRVVAPGYDPAGAVTNSRVAVQSALGIAPGDLMVLAQDASLPCEVFQVSPGAAAPGLVARADDGGWNASGHPGASYGDGSLVVDLGTLSDRRFTVAGSQLRESRFQLAAADSAPSYTAPAALFANIVGLRAFYGKDTDGDGVVDTYDQVQPASAIAWTRVLTVRLALLARSEQYEKEVVTETYPLWSVGSDETFSPAPAPCGAGRCFSFDPSAQADWQHYRYKLFETVVPLRNLIWQS